MSGVLDASTCRNSSKTRRCAKFASFLSGNLLSPPFKKKREKNKNLQRRVVRADGPSSQLHPIQDNIVVQSAHAQGVPLKVSQVVRMDGSEGVVRTHKRLTGALCEHTRFFFLRRARKKKKNKKRVQ